MALANKTQVHGVYYFLCASTLFLFTLLTDWQYDLIFIFHNLEIPAFFKKKNLARCEKKSWLADFEDSLPTDGSVAMPVRCNTSLLPRLCHFNPPGCLSVPWAPGGRRGHLICKHSDGRFLKKCRFCYSVLNIPHLALLSSTDSPTRLQCTVVVFLFPFHFFPPYYCYTLVLCHLRSHSQPSNPHIMAKQDFTKAGVLSFP